MWGKWNVSASKTLCKHHQFWRRPRQLKSSTKMRDTLFSRKKDKPLAFGASNFLRSFVHVDNQGYPLVTPLWLIIFKSCGVDGIKPVNTTRPPLKSTLLASFIKICIYIYLVYRCICICVFSSFYPALLIDAHSHSGQFLPLPATFTPFQTTFEKIIAGNMRLD